MGRFSRRLLVAIAVAVSACAYYDDSLLAPIDGAVESGGGGASGAEPAGAGGAEVSGGTSGNGTSGNGGAGEAGSGSSVGGAAGQAGATQGGSAGNGGAALPACVSKRPPGPPMGSAGSSAGTAGASGAAGEITFDLALRDFDFGETSTTNKAGYDLDGACTACSCQGDTSSRCLLPKLTDGVATTDGTEGEDHGARALFLAASPFLTTISSTGIKQAVDAGEFTVLLRIANYNQQLNDPQVTVAWYVGTKLPKMPAWDGNDAWPIREYAVKNKDVNQPLSVDSNAYVRDGVLVAGPKGPDGTSREVPFQVSADFRVLISGVFVTGKLVPSGSTFSLEEGILAGKWSTDDVLRQMSGLRVFGQQLCPGTDPYLQLATKVCSTADIALFDGSPTDPCTAISIGVSYRATPAKLGPVADQPPPANDCKTPFESAKHGCGAL